MSYDHLAHMTYELECLQARYTEMWKQAKELHDSMCECYRDMQHQESLIREYKLRNHPAYDVRRFYKDVDDCPWDIHDDRTGLGVHSHCRNEGDPAHSPEWDDYVRRSAMAHGSDYYS